MSLLAMAFLVTGCAGASMRGSAWPGRGFPLEMSEEMLEEGASAEASRAVTWVMATARGAREVGARLSFTFWSEHGALTLTRYRAGGRGGLTGQEADEEALRHTLTTALQQFAQQRTGMVEVTLERQDAAWSVGYSRIEAEPPPQVKTMPVRREGVAVDAEATVSELRRLLAALDVPAGAQAQLDLVVHLEDWRAEAFELQRFEVLRRSPDVEDSQPGSSAAGEAAYLVQLFTEGLGERTVHLRVRLSRAEGARRPNAWVEGAAVVHLPPPPAMNAEFVAEYRALHEDILRRWREETQEGAQWVARQGVEELALWYVGGVLVKGVGWLGIRTLPTVMRALGRGGEASAGWLRTVLRRLSVEERQVFERLWMKAQLEGRSALSHAEREELRVLMEGLEQLSKTPLEREAKKNLRRAAREAYKKVHPEFATLLDEAGGDQPIHHRLQLEHAHLFPDMDINATDNLVMVMKEVHDPVTRLWERFRRACPAATARQVEEAARIIDGQFKPWYNQPAAPPGVPYSLKKAEEAALEQLQRLFPGLE
jgi:hypothetical protein